MTQWDPNDDVRAALDKAHDHDDEHDHDADASAEVAHDRPPMGEPGEHPDHPEVAGQPAPQ